MSSAVSTLPSAAPAKSPKRRAKSQRKKTGPTVSDLILKAASSSSERSGVSLPALKKALKAGGYDVVKNNARILTAIRRLVANKSLVQTKGSGASGSFKLNKKPPTPRKKVVVKKKKKKKKPKRVKRASPKKVAGGATPEVKKSPKKKRKPKSPAKKSAAAKKARSPKKAKRRVAMSTRTRAAAKK